MTAEEAEEQARTLFFEALDLLDGGDNTGAETKLRAALERAPDRVAVLVNLAAALFRQNRIDEAAGFAERATAQDGADDNAWLILAWCRSRQARHDQALEAFDRILDGSPDDAESWLGKADALSKLGRFDEAVAAFRRAADLDPELTAASGDYVRSRMRICDWNGIEEDWAALRTAAVTGEPATSPGYTTTLPGDAAERLAIAQTYVQAHLPPQEPLYRGEAHDHERFRIAYLSSGFREHPVALLAAGIFEAHDRELVDTIALSTAADDGSPVRSRLERAFDRFVDAENMSDADMARAVRDMEVDILVDLDGHNTGGRLGVLAHRPAPVQVSYLGFAGTTGAAFVDYLIADPIVVPPGEEGLYAEKIVRLPHTVVPTDAPSLRPANTAPTRAEAGLPEDGFVFCAFAEPHRITPDVFDIWMRLLGAVDGSVLWLGTDDETAAANLAREAGKRGIDPARLVHAPEVPRGVHLARLKHADLFLDTLYDNAGAAAVDALAAGVPLLTRVGETFAGRIGASLAWAAGIPELAVESLADYEARALQLATNPLRLNNFGKRLEAGRWEMAPLWDTEHAAQALETAFMTMVGRARNGEPPAGFDLSPLEAHVVN